MGRGATAPERSGDRSPGSLASIMERLGEGDGAALYSLIEAHRTDLVRSVRSMAGRRRARLSAEQVEELVVEAALAIASVAGSWTPDGAPPWFYASGRIANAVDRVIGQWHDGLDDERADHEQPPAAAGSEAQLVEVLDRLAADHEVVALLRDGLEVVASPRDLLVFVEHGVQVALGDPSPAVTIGRMYGMEPAAVRQQTRRVRLRLRRLAATDPRFGELVSLPLVA